MQQFYSREMENMKLDR